MTTTADETTQGCHPFTVSWWQRLPTAFRRADRAQGYRLTDAWHGLNRDPRFVTGWDGWHRTNTSDKPWQASVSFTRTFRAAPRSPVHIRTWHAPVTVDVNGVKTPLLSATRIRHVVRNYAGQIILDDSPVGSGSTSGQTVILEGGDIYVGDEDVYDAGTVTEPAATGTTTEDQTTAQDPDQIIHHSRILPDRFGVIQVVIHVSIDITDQDLADNVHIGPENYLAAIHVGHQDVLFEDLPDLAYFTTAAAYPLLRYMDGIGHQAGFLSDMVNDMHDGRWTNPVTAPESRLMFLSAIVGVPYRYASRLTMEQLRQHLVDLVEGNSPTPGSADHIAITAKQWLTGNKDVSVMPAHSVSTYTGPDPAHTIIVTARADEVPQNDLPAFAQFLNDSGVIPAGHDVRVLEAVPDWDAREAAAGATWDEQSKSIKTWNDSDSAGVNLGGTGA